MAALTDRDVLAALHTVIDHERGGSIVSLDMVKGVTLRGGNVAFMIEVDARRGPHMEPLRKAAEDAVMRLPGVTSVSAVLTAERASAPAPQSQAGADVTMARRQAAAGPMGSPGAPAAKPFVPGVKHILAVASGKGGVGKSTVAVNLALGLVAEGKRVGLLDADIYGPSVPRLLGLKGRPEPTADKRLKPMEAYGLKAMSMGFLVPEDTAMIWRGPMVIGALEQLLRDVAWADDGDLDVLVVDMPPGTGDAQLTIAQRVPLAGSVIVSTPQDIALIDARKGLNMFKKVEVPVLGIVENMSTFVCPNCGHESHIFGHGGAKAEAEKLGVEFLGEVPLHIAIRETSDAGTPITATQPDSPQAKAYRAIAKRVWEKIDGAARKTPRIVVT